MNILFLSHLHGEMWAGPSHSVPKQVEAQSKQDNVLWYNLKSNSKQEWKVLDYYCDLDDYPNESINQLPKPFCSPDVVIIEQIYDFGRNLKIINEVLKKKIPYIIVPRSEFTKAAQKRKYLKKYIANILIFRRIIRNAISLHYLTEKEKKDSGDKWCEKSYIIPNGIEIPCKIEKKMTNDNLRIVYIGRLEIYQKGLDNLIKSCEKIKEKLREKKCRISIYGPNIDDSKNILKKMICDASMEDIIDINNEIFGAEKEKVLLEADIFIMTSRFEGLPMGMIEALSYGIPCIATLGTNITDVIEKYNAGWFTEDDMDSISNTIIKAIDSNDIISTKGENARELAKKYSWNSIAKDTHDTISKLLDLKRKDI